MLKKIHIFYTNEAKKSKTKSAQLKKITPWVLQQLHKRANHNFVFFIGIKSIRTSVTGFPLPNPRSISARVHKDAPRPHRSDISFMFAAFGQLIDHDLTLTAETKGTGEFRSYYSTTFAVSRLVVYEQCIFRLIQRRSDHQTRNQMLFRSYPSVLYSSQRTDGRPVFCGQSPSKMY